MKLSVVIPALNEEEGIAAVINQVPVQKLEELGYKTEIIVVDNASTDRTAEIASQHGARVVFQPNRGYGNAYKAGFASATGDIIATGDADMTYPFDMLPEILKAMRDNGVEFLNTNRLETLNPEAMTFSHVIGNWGLSLVTRVLFGWPYRDSQSGMWIFKREIWQHLDVRSPGMPFSQELKIEAYAKGFICDELPIEYRPRVGQVKLNTMKDGIRNISQLFLKRFTLSSKRSDNDDMSASSLVTNK